MEKCEWWWLRLLGSKFRQLDFEEREQAEQSVVSLLALEPLKPPRAWL